MREEGCNRPLLLNRSFGHIDKWPIPPVKLMLKGTLMFISISFVILGFMEPNFSTDNDDSNPIKRSQSCRTFYIFTEKIHSICQTYSPPAPIKSKWPTLLKWFRHYYITHISLSPNPQPTTGQ